MTVKSVCHVFYTIILINVDNQPANHHGPLSARQRSAIRMAFRWRADSDLILRTYWVTYLYFRNYETLVNQYEWPFPSAGGMACDSICLQRDGTTVSTTADLVHQRPVSYGESSWGRGSCGSPSGKLTNVFVAGERVSQISAQ